MSAETSDMTLHERLIALQSREELERKHIKSSGRYSRRIWTQEWLDLCDRESSEFVKWFNDRGAVMSR